MQNMLLSLPTGARNLTWSLTRNLTRFTSSSATANSSSSSKVNIQDDSSSSSGKRAKAAKLLQQLPHKDLSDFVLTDTFGRHHSYLRISLTEKCNLR